ncbi:hypothetical protein [Ralstonia insidiosa]|jgi:hypothetical protein|nr:hypothetical protein [Ralstonia insidiosa]MBA9940568.1 hypothetical protein [Ralstonia insidiosa]MBC9968981.1 hypothetical protein [Ralstonia insidiosa]MBX3905064.1 hypothetical protein [Ralstonia insidiosa]
MPVPQYWVEAVKHETAVDLLQEALGKINDKPWEDPTLLHARISEYLGQPVKYADAVVLVRKGKI